MALPEEFLERLKQSNDIVSAMSGYAELKRAGRDYVCLCPFHSEKSASCHVYVDSQSFYCFGCGAGGSVFTFVQLTQNLSFMEAVRLLAERSGIPMPEDGNGEAGMAELRRRSRIYEMNKSAAKFWRDCLISAPNEGSVFLQERGLNANTVRKYGLGYAAESWNDLKRHMNEQGYGDDELVDASLLKRNEHGKVYDMFRGRVMFPVIDAAGRVIAFSGRIVSENTGDGNFKAGKYVNSTDTPVYRKGENVFSINFAKNAKNKSVILCEGNIDAVMLNQAGFDNAVAILGTALTPAQARLLRRYCDDVVLAYDSDVAGEKATVKAINLLNHEGMSARVLQMQGANDPDEYIKKFGAESFGSLLEQSGSATHFELSKLEKAVDTDTPEGRADLLKHGVELLAAIENEHERMVYGGELARKCGVSAAGVADALEKRRRINSRQRHSQERRELLQPKVKRDAINPESADYPAQEKAEQCIIAYLFHSPDKLPVILRNLSPGDFPTAFNRKLFETLILKLNKRVSIA
ncbi:MAG: DNA primase, partial [Oscillospiraceae bacterium]|nr:DNA primase [Oscillospiraceae bacterium]